MANVYWRGNREQFRELMRSVIAACQGHGPDVGGVAHGVFLSVGFAALGDIQQDYIRKSHGGAGEFSPAWPALSPKTIAARRLGPKDRKLEHIAERLKREAEATKAARKAFTAQANEERKRLQKEHKWLLARLSLSLEPKEAKARAKYIIGLRRKGLNERIAAQRQAADFKLRGKFAVTAATGEKRWEVMSRREVDILRDTGVGLASLSQGKLSSKGPNAVYTKPTSTAKGRLGDAKREGGEQQVFEELKDGIIVGTNVPYMEKHQNGDPAKGLKPRPFLPIGPVPRVWAQRWADAGLEALTIGVTQLVTATA